MSDEPTLPDGIELEPERYELDGALPYRFAVGRRGFLGLLGGVVVLVAAPPGSSQESGRAGRAEGQESDLAAWLHIAEDGSVTVFTGKVEFGQNARTSLAQAVAEELRAPLSTIRLVMGDTDLTPFDMGTFGSRSTPYMAPQLRKAAVVARELLKELAGTQWSVEAATLEVADGQVEHPPTKRTLGFGALTKGQKLVRTIAGEVKATPADRWTIAGRSATKVNAREIVTGRHRYTSDLGPGPFAPSELLHGKVLRPPAMGATLASIEQASIESLAGAVVVTDGDFVGIAARTAAEAARALESLRPKWNLTPQPEGRELEGRLRQAPEATARGARAAAAGPTSSARSPTRARKPRIASRPPTPSPTSRTSRSSRAPRWRSGRTAVSPSGPGPSVRSA